jgi:hypothetical protein
VELNKLKKLISYNPINGLLIRKIYQGGPSKAGCVVGHETRFGYLSVTVGGKPYQAHRLAWMLHYGVVPTGTIDHINGIKTDNRICNLRDVSHQENCKNQHIARVKKTNTPLGVTVMRGKYVAQVMRNGKNIYLGSHETSEAASIAYKKFREQENRCA